MLIKNVSNDVRFISHGLRRMTAVKPGETVEIPDEHAEAYTCQGDVWKPAGKTSDRSVVEQPAGQGK